MLRAGRDIALTTDCENAASYEITSAGMIYAVLTMTLSTNTSGVLSEHFESASISQTFSVGSFARKRDAMNPPEEPLDSVRRYESAGVS